MAGNEAGWAGVSGQAARFVLVGAFLSVLTFLTYVAPAVYCGMEPILAYWISYCVTVVTGYVLHSRLSFAARGARDQLLVRRGRFTIVSLVSLGMNSFFVWLLTVPLGGPPWWPIAPMIMVTPTVTFLLNRQWVFGR
jgi:putative flippase GtrA